MPSISIITPTFNSAKTISDCLDSVSAQEVKVEHIIVDGNSRDATLIIAKSYTHISKIICEPDQGMYDAMNKGLLAATGDVIGILNSDDFYSDKQVSKRISKVFADPNIDSCYGDLLYIDRDNTNRVTRIWKSSPFKHRAFYWGWMPPHPTFFVRRSVYKKYGAFNLEFGSAADYELMLRFLVKHKISTVYIPEYIVRMRTGGISNATLQNRFKANRMDRLAWIKNGLKPYPWTIYLKPLSKVLQFSMAGKMRYFS